MLLIALPLLAVGLPWGALLWMRGGEGRRVKRPWRIAVGSFAVCCLALCLEIHVLGVRAEHGDISGILDTWRAVRAFCAALSAVTLLSDLLFLRAAFQENAPAPGEEEQNNKNL